MTDQAEPTAIKSKSDADWLCLCFYSKPQFLTFSSVYRWVWSTRFYLNAMHIVLHDEHLPPSVMVSYPFLKMPGIVFIFAHCWSFHSVSSISCYGEKGGSNSSVTDHVRTYHTAFP